MRQRLTKKLQFNLNYTWSATRSNFDGDNPLGSVNDASENVQEFAARVAQVQARFSF